MSSHHQRSVKKHVDLQVNTKQILIPMFRSLRKDVTTKREQADTASAKYTVGNTTISQQPEGFPQ